MDPVLLSSLVAVAAVVSPIVSVVIQNIYTTKLNERAFVAEHKVKAIESYLSLVGRFLFYQSSIDKSVADGISSIFIYAPESLHPQIKEMNQMLIEIENLSCGEERDDKYSLARQKYMELCQAFSVISKKKNWYKKL